MFVKYKCCIVLCVLYSHKCNNKPEFLFRNSKKDAKFEMH